MRLELNVPNYATEAADSERQVSQTVHWKQELLAPLLCSVALLVCVAVANPFVNSPFDDDWSYSDVALRLAQTGHMHYNGWGSPTILLQCAWAALFIRIFGFSFNVLRYATLPFSVGFVCVTYFLGRQVGLRPNFAGLAALGIGVSPLFVPLAATFMTEPYSCFFSMLCVYAALRSAQSTSPGSANNWLWVLTISGILGGSDRQTVWLAPLLLIPYVAWVRRATGTFLRQSAMAYAVCLISLLAVLMTLKTRYPADEFKPQEWLEMARYFGWQASQYIISLLLVAALMCLPALLCAFPLWRLLRFWTAIALLAICALVLCCLRFGFGKWLGIVPFLGNILTAEGLLGNRTAISYRPLYLHHWLTYPLTVVLIVGIAARFGLSYKRVLLWQLPRHTGEVFAIFIVPYLLLLVPGALLEFCYDRYAVPIMPLLAIAALYPIQALLVRPPVLAWIAAFALAIYAIATTHDYARALEARASGAEMLESRDIAPLNISAGIEHDGWLHVRDTGIIEVTSWKKSVRASYNHFLFWHYTTAIHPDYVVITAPLADVPKREILNVPYRNWLPLREFAAYAIKRVDIPAPGK